jgi:MFS family permease
MLSYLWHAVFLALAQNLIDIDTIIPAMLIDAGGSSIHIGILSAIMLGGSSFAQLFFTPYLSNKPRKKSFLLFGINLRIVSLLGLGLLLHSFTSEGENQSIIWSIFILITLFSVSGAFAAIGYSDILGRSIFENKRKSFLSLRQAISSIGILISAYIAAEILVIFDYPVNYSWLFISAAIMLSIASLGFWNIKEIPGPTVAITSLRNYLYVIVKEIKENKRLANYLLLVNTLGLSLTILPFLTLYSKEIVSVSNSNVANFLLLKVLAGVLSGVVLFYFSKRIKYSLLLYSASFIALFISVNLLFEPSLKMISTFYFLGGIMYTFYKIAIEGVLLEVSDHKNRTIYIGMVGAGSIIPTLFPILGGWLIPKFGFNYFFLILSIAILLAIYFIKCLNCKK